MQLSDSDLYLLGQCAISAAFQAGHLIVNRAHDTVQVNSKQGGISKASQVVTEVDLLSQEIILQTLEPACALFDLAVLTEESPDDKERLEKDYFWCIDPLDGTLPFIESTPGYSVSIALVSREGIPVIGVIYDPVEKTLYFAIKGCGAFRNGLPWQWQLNSDSSPQSLCFISDRSFKQHNLYTNVLDELNRIAMQMGYEGVKLIQQGGAAMNACWVLENSPACYFKFPIQKEGGGSLWDFAASACIFKEANAIASDIQGHCIDLNRPDSTFMNHHGILFASDNNLAKQIMNLYKQLTSK